MVGPNMEVSNRKKRVTRASTHIGISATPPPSTALTSSLPLSTDTPLAIPSPSVPASSVPASSVPSASSRTRGYSRSVTTSRPQASGAPQRRPVIIPDGTDRPICDNTSALVTEIGVLVRNHIPPQYATWKQVPQEYKDQVIHRVVDLFEIDMEHPPHKKFVHGRMHDAVKEFRFELHRDYKLKVAEKGLEETRRNKLPRVHSDEDCEILVSSWESEAFKKKSDTNKTNRANIPYGHKASSKSYAKNFAELKAKEPDVGYVRLFEHTHSHGPKDWVNNVAKNKHKEMVGLQRPPSPVQCEDGAEPTPITHVPTDAEIFERVMGTESGYIRGLGKGLKPPSRSRTTSISSVDSQLVETKQQLTSVMLEIAAMRQEVVQLKEEQERERLATRAQMDEIMRMFRESRGEGGPSS